MLQVTPDECQRIVKDLGIRRLGHHRCAECGWMIAHVFYETPLSRGMLVGFDPSCRCDVPHRGILPMTWEDFAEVFNMQPFPEVRDEMWERFKVGKSTHDDE
jgi:hypothetical protein